MSLIHLRDLIPIVLETRYKIAKDTLKHKYSVKDSRELLSYLIKQKFGEWQIYNVDPENDNYITEANMKKAIEYIIKNIILEMTPTMQDVLSVGYPMSTEEDMIEVIKNGAKLEVLHYSIQQNTPKEHDEVIKNINAF